MMTQKEAIREIIRKEIEKGHIAGANVKISRDHRVLMQESFGMADIEQNRPMTQDTIFRMFSMSKIVTSAAAMIVMQRGQIDLYDPVSMYLEGFASPQVALDDNRFVPAERPVLIRDLLNMTCGCCYPGIEDAAARIAAEEFVQLERDRRNGQHVGTVEFANRLGRLPLAFEPGTHWRYGTGADIMGAVVEVVTGKRFGQFLQEELFDPCGMTDTGFYVPVEKKERFAQAYRFHEKTGELKILTGTHLGMEGYDRAPEFESGGAGLVSTIDDYSAFAQMLLDEGKAPNGEKIFGRETLRFMRTNQIPASILPELNWDSLHGFGYGNFVRMMMDPSTSGNNVPVGTFGWDGWLGTYILMDPQDNMIFQYYIQLADAGATPATRRMLSAVFGML